MAEEVTTELRVGRASLKRDLDDAKREFARFRRDIEREAATIRVNSGGFGAPRAGGGGGDAGGDGVRGISRFTRGVGSAVSSLVVVEGLIESGAVAAQALGATADLLKGNTRAAVDKLADAGEEAKKLPLLGNIARPLERFLGFITGINAQIAELERETKEMDAKTARMAKKNEAIRGANAKFKGMIEAGRVGTAADEGGSAAGQLQAVRQRIADFDEFVKNTPYVDKDEAEAARRALKDEENRLMGETGATREKQERDHQNRLTGIMAEGQAARLRAAAEAEQDEEKRRELDREADRQDLAVRQKMIREAIIGRSIGGTPDEQRRAQEEIDALKPTQEAERAQQESKFGREDRERQEKEAERQKKEFDRLMDELKKKGEEAAREEQQAYEQIFKDKMKALRDRPIGGGFTTSGEQYGSHLQNAILTSSTGTEAGTMRAAIKELEKAAEKMASLPLIGVVDRQ
jgi:hypothetical protein